MAIKLIIGLRNPGPSYEGTRHNAGEWFVKSLIDFYGVALKVEKKFHAELTQFKHNEVSCKVMLPLMFMNHSGLPSKEVSQFYRILSDEILVVHDDLDLPPGSIRLKTGGGNGGHNGLRDIEAHLGCSDFHRLRIGIGHPGHKNQVLNYVLGKPSVHDRQLIMEAIDKAVAVMPMVLAENITGAMNLLHR